MTSDHEDGARHKAKMEKRKAVQDAEVAAKTAEKGLLIVHTGKGKGKSTRRSGSCSGLWGGDFAWASCNSAKARGTRESARPSRLLAIGLSGMHMARGSPGRRKTGRGTSQRRSAPGPRLSN